MLQKLRASDSLVRCSALAVGVLVGALLVFLGGLIYLPHESSAIEPLIKRICPIGGIIGGLGATLVLGRMAQAGKRRDLNALLRIHETTDIGASYPDVLAAY